MTERKVGGRLRAALKQGVTSEMLGGAGMRQWSAESRLFLHPRLPWLLSRARACHGLPPINAHVLQ